jgi:hypothetical protein
MFSIREKTCRERKIRIGISGGHHGEPESWQQEKFHGMKK